MGQLWDRISGNRRSTSVKPGGNIPQEKLDVVRERIAARRNGTPPPTGDNVLPTKKTGVPPWTPEGWVPTKDHQWAWANGQPVISPLTGKTHWPPGHEPKEEVVAVEEPSQPAVHHEEEIPIHLSAEPFSGQQMGDSPLDDSESREASGSVSGRGGINLDPKNPKMNTDRNKPPTWRKTLSVLIIRVIGSWMLLIIGFHLGIWELFPGSTFFFGSVFFLFGIAILSKGQSPLVSNKSWYLKVGLPLLVLGTIILTLSLAFYMTWLQKFFLFVIPQ